jgi:uncharacterized protein
LAENGIMPREIIGRDTERALLEKHIQSSKSEFIAVYGRRRVGKTFLIREYFQNKFTFYATGLANANTAKQLTSFTIFINQSFNTNYATFSDWLTAFQALIAELKKNKDKKQVLFLDELPWMDTKKSDFITALEFFWNSWASAQSNIKLIVCGSAASWIINNLIKNKGGLHNRLTCRIKLEPFTLKETELFFNSKNVILDRYQIVQLYMVMGGIPYYLDAVQPGLSALQNIQQLCFDKMGLLHSEFTFIFESLFANGKKHDLIVRRIHQLGGNCTRDQLIAAGKLSSGGDVSVKLQELEESGFIHSYNKYGTSIAKKIYAISDFYTLFFLRFIEPSSKRNKAGWTNDMNDPGIKAWSGFTFEQICLQHTQQIKAALQISGISSKATTWTKTGTEKTQGAQVDLIIDRSDWVINLCEIKFSINEFTITKAYDQQLRNKIAAFKENIKTKKSVFLTMITTYGLVKNEYSRSIVQNEITMDDLFAV